MWKRQKKSVKSNSEAPPPLHATGTSGEITPNAETSPPLFKKPDFSGFRRTNDQVKGWLNTNNPFQKETKPRDCLASVIVADDDDPPPPYTPSAGGTAGTLPRLSHPGANTHRPSETTAQGADRPPPYRRTDRRTLSATTTTTTALAPVPPARTQPARQADSQPAVTEKSSRTAPPAQPQKVTSPVTPAGAAPYSVFGRLNDSPSDVQMGSPAGHTTGPSVRSSVVTHSVSAHRRSQASEMVESEYNVAMDEYFDDFFGIVNEDPPVAHVEPHSPALPKKSPTVRASPCRRSQPSNKASINSWYRPDSSSYRSDGSEQPNNSHTASRQRTSAPRPHNEAASTQPTDSTVPGHSTKVGESARARYYPPLSVFRKTRVKEQTDAPPPPATEAPTATAAAAPHKPSLSVSAVSDTEAPLMRTNDLAPSKWAYVALFATKVKEARETKLRASRINRGRAPAPAHDSSDPKRHTVEPSVFALGRMTTGEDDDVTDDEEVEVSEVCDDDGNRLAEPTMSFLWADFVSDEETDARHTDDESDALHAEESAGFAADNMPSVFPATRTRPSVKTSPQKSPDKHSQGSHSSSSANTPTGGRMARPAPARARPQAVPAPENRAEEMPTPFVRPNMQAALLAQQQHQQQQQIQQQQQRRQWAASPGAQPQAGFRPSPPKAYSPQTPSPGQQHPQYYNRRQQQQQQPTPQQAHPPPQPSAPLSGPPPGMKMVKAGYQGGPEVSGYTSNFAFVPRTAPPDPQPNIRGPRLQGRRPVPPDFARLYGWRLTDARWVDSPTASPRLGVQQDQSYGTYNVKHGVDEHTGHRRQRA